MHEFAFAIPAHEKANFSGSTFLIKSHPLNQIPTLLLREAHKCFTRSIIPSYRALSLISTSVRGHLYHFLSNVNTNLIKKWTKKITEKNWKNCAFNFMDIFHDNICFNKRVVVEIDWKEQRWHRSNKKKFGRSELTIITEIHITRKIYCESKNQEIQLK